MNTTGFEAIPGWAWPVIGVIALVQLGVQIWALVDLIRRPSDQVKSSKWLWAVLIILLSNFALGAILYFVIGREPEAIDVRSDAGSGEDHGSAQRAVDTLYGESDES